MVNFLLKNSQAWELICLLRDVYRESPPEKGEMVAGILDNDPPPRKPLGLQPSG